MRGASRPRLSMLTPALSAIALLTSFLLAARPAAAGSVANARARDAATVQAVTPVPPPDPAFTILAVRAENNGGKADWNLAHAAVSKVATGTAITLSIYVNFQFLPNGASMTVDFPLTLDGHVIHEAGLTSTLNGSDTGNLWLHRTFTPEQSGKYDLSGVVTVNGQTEKESTSFTATPPRSQPHPFWFTFNSLRSFDSRGHVASTFAGTNRVSIVAYWTVHNLQRPSTVWVTETLEYPVGRGWRPLGQPLQNSFGTSNGFQSYRFSFVPSASYRSLRIVIRLGIAGKRQQRPITIQLHK